MLDTLLSYSGDFDIHFSWMSQAPDLLAKVMQHFVVCKCEADFNRQCLRYCAYSKLFKESERHCHPRRYRIVVRLSPMMEIDNVEAVPEEITRTFRSDHHLRDLCDRY